MRDKIVIAIDAMGGENAPDKTIQGLKFFLLKNDKRDYHFNLYGDKDKISQKLKDYKISDEAVEIFHTDAVVKDNETPLTAIKNSKNTSMWNCINAQVNNKADISLSAGNTGVMLVISRMILKTMPEVSKPALAGLWPNELGFSVVLDLGANIDCDSSNLLDFSEMGSALYKSLFPNDTPKLALLNIGSEEIKGTEILKKTYSKLTEICKNNDIVFNGYIEGNKLMDGHSNVIVTDGFTGNIALKTAEGTAKFITNNLKRTFNKNILNKLSFLLSFLPLSQFKKKLDPRKYNGAIFLGLQGPVVKSHGSTDAFGFFNSIELCYKIVKGNLMTKIKDNLSHLPSKDDQ